MTFHITESDRKQLVHAASVLDTSEGFSLVIIECEPGFYCAAARDALAELFSKKRALSIEIKENDLSVFDQIVAEEIETEQDLLIVWGLESIVPIGGPWAPILENLNHSRPKWLTSLPCPIVMFMAPRVLDAATLFAPDFLRLRGATLELQGSAESQQLPSSWQFIESQEARRLRLSDLRRRLVDDTPADPWARMGVLWEASLIEAWLGLEPSFEECVYLASMLGRPRLPSEGAGWVVSLELDDRRGSWNQGVLASLWNLRSLSMSFQGSAEFSASSLLPLRRLERLRVFGQHIPGESIGMLRLLPSLTSLGIRGASLNAEMAAEIGSLDTLQLFSLDDSTENSLWADSIAEAWRARGAAAVIEVGQNASQPSRPASRRIVKIPGFADLKQSQSGNGQT